MQKSPFYVPNKCGAVNGSKQPWMWSPLFALKQQWNRSVGRYKFIRVDTGSQNIYVCYTGVGVGIFSLLKGPSSLCRWDGSSGSPELLFKEQHLRCWASCQGSCTHIRTQPCQDESNWLSTSMAALASFFNVFPPCFLVLFLREQVHLCCLPSVIAHWVCFSLSWKLWSVCPFACKSWEKEDTGLNC